MKASFKPSTLASALLLLGGLSWLTSAAQAQGGDLLKQIQPNDEMLKAGAASYKTNCAACHGPEGKGDGQPALKPRNFHAKDAWKNSMSFAGMYKTLEEGLPGTAMSSFSQLSAKERVALIHHIRSLASANYPEITAQDAETLQKDYSLADALSKGANQAISVDKAIELLIKEAEPQQAQVKKALEKLHAANDKGAQMVLDSTSDPERALTLLINAGNSWKGSVQDFSGMIMYSADSNGFRVSNNSYTSAQWQELQNALKKLL